MKTVLIVLVVLFLGWLIIYLPFFGWHKVTSEGWHAGYVTAVEKSGVIWKTGRAYIKTDLSSSQEDIYCVMDDEVYAQLKDASDKRQKVTTTYLGYMSAGVTNCDAEGEIITSVKVLE